MAITVVAAPASDPVTLAEVKARIRVDDADDDVHLAFLIKAATRTVEGETWRHIVERTIDWTLDAFSPELIVPVHPVQSITSIKYLDGDGVEQTLDAAKYRLAKGGDRGPARITPAYDQVWPQTRPVTEAVTIRMVTGGVVDHIADELKLGLMALVGHWHQQREAAIISEVVREVPSYMQSALASNRLPV